MPRAQPGQRFGGRAKGTPNKTTSAAKEALSLAFQGVGGVEALTEWATDNQTEFYKLWAKLVPLEVSGEGGEPIKFVIVTGVPQPAPKPADA
jgi:hypothetical protein